jgi:DUF917 family protein
VNSATIPVFQGLLVEESVFAKILPEVKKNTIPSFFEVDFVSTDSICPVIDSKRDYPFPSYPIVSLASNKYRETNISLYDRKGARQNISSHRNMRFNRKADES